MKRILFLTICVACANIVAAGNCVLPEMTELQGRRCSIYLQGSLAGTVSLRSMSTSSPVEVYLDDQNIEVNFKSSLGNLNIVVVNAQGYPVYQQTVNATAGGKLNISTRYWSSGSYTIYISNGRGGSLEGAFAID